MSEVNEKLLAESHEIHIKRCEQAIATIQEIAKRMQVDKMLANDKQWKAEVIQSEIGALRLAIEALEKQIPKSGVFNRDEMPVCPTCGCMTTKLVCDCGQQIIWGGAKKPVEA